MRTPRLSQSMTGWRRALAVCGGVVLIDQVTKAIVVATIPVDEHRDLALGFSFTNSANTGLAFGIGGGHGVVLAVTIAALALVLLWFALDPARPGLWLAVGLLAGGALGNLADRVRADAVTDFIDPPFWPAFNLADVAITLGAVWLLLASLGAESHGGAERWRA
ncbi:MAG TPA: signal peptidase II [Solirubrobacterales bacterium]|nr:signal peptidase II [Solirubrobacterales bacterium]